MATTSFQSSSNSRRHRLSISWPRKTSRRRLEEASTMESPLASPSRQAYDWLAEDCPVDILPVVLAFCGPQTTAALSKSNSHWRNTIHTQAMWRGLCEENNKWKQGDPEPDCWFDYYRFNPCVPVDYSTIDKALAVVQAPQATTNGNNSRRSRLRPPPTAPDPNTPQTKNLRILLYPGKYGLRKPITVHTMPGVTLTLEALQLSPNVFRPTSSTDSSTASSEIMEQPLPEDHRNSSSSSSKRSRSLRSFLSCSRVESMDDSETEEDSWDDLLESSHASSSPATRQYHATLLMRSRKHDEPTFMVKQGHLILKNIGIHHQSTGLDIWNGNAAVQIQPLTTSHQATASLTRCWVTSTSGRGIVSIDGGHVHLNHCWIHECAATGVYIGGPGSAATIRSTDVCRNGIGNRVRRGIARGHSGIYLERGNALICDSNVSSNTLTGISVISPDFAQLELRDCSLMANGTFQLELPDVGTASRRRIVTENNAMEQHGEPTLRSGILAE